MLLIAVTFVSFVIFFLVPANPARLMAGNQATPEHVERIEKLLGLDDPVPVQYARFLKQLVVDQSLGRSFATRQDVNDIIKAAAPVTASLVFGGVVIWLMIAFPIGIRTAIRPRT
jgi:peptide/nickel transport system permease protein